MTQLTSPEIGFLNAADPGRHANPAIGAVAVINGAMPDFSCIKSTLGERIREIPRCTQVSRAAWIDDRGFDLDHHLRRAAIARPGRDAELFRAVTDVLERPFNPNRPQWECWIIEGLKDNQWAILMKVHHTLADDVSPAHILTRLCDDADAETFVHAGGAGTVSGDEAPGWNDALRQAAAVVGGVSTALAQVIWPTQPSGRLTSLRRYSTVRVPIAAVDDVCRKFNVTANDVAVAAITEGFRAVLLQRGEQPRADSLPTTGPVDKLPVESDDPVQRLRAVHRLRQAKQANQPGGILDFLPFALAAKAIQVLTRLPQRGIVTLVTSAPGPRQLLRLMDQPIKRLLPIPPTALRLSTGVAVLSYGDELVFGITADYEAGPELERLSAGIELGMARLAALSQDSVLLFTTDHRKRRARAAKTAAHRRHPSALPPPARHTRSTTIE